MENASNMVDSNKIELEDDNLPDQLHNDSESQTKEADSNQIKSTTNCAVNSSGVCEEDKEKTVSKTSKDGAIVARLRRLKQRMNQARTLNDQAVKEEAVQSTAQGKVQAKIRQVAEHGKARETMFRDQNTQVIEMARQVGVHGTADLTETAADNLKRANQRANRMELSQYSVNDYHNPEGQFRNYQRNLKSLHNENGTGSVTATAIGSSSSSSVAVFDPAQHQLGLQPSAALEGGHSSSDREGARRVARELHRRMEKRQERDRKRKEREQDTVSGSYINQRNQQFNKKIQREYDAHTTEIRHNLERGTAL